MFDTNAKPKFLFLSSINKILFDTRPTDTKIGYVHGVPIKTLQTKHFTGKYERKIQ